MNNIQFQIAKNFSEINGAKFVGIKGYTSKTSGETANYVVNAGFSYENAIERDLNKLKNLSSLDIDNIAFETGIQNDIVINAKNEMINSFEKNRDEETQSNQSKAQNETYINITKGIKIHRETEQVYIYALSVAKEVLIKGEYKMVKSQPKTIAKKAIGKYLDLSTAKFRQFIVSPEHLTAVKSTGNTFSIV